MGAKKYLGSVQGGEQLKVQIGAIVIALAVLLVTFLLFGKNLGQSFKSKFRYWLVSTLMMAPVLFSWFVCNEPATFSLLGVAVSIGVAAVFALGRSYLIAML